MRLSIVQGDLCSFTVYFHDFLGPFRIVRHAPRVIVRVHVKEAILCYRPVDYSFSLVVSWFVFFCAGIGVYVSILDVGFGYFVVVAGNAFLVSGFKFTVSPVGVYFCVLEVSLCYFKVICGDFFVVAWF